MSQHLQSQSTVLMGARQTKSTWSRVIETREDIPSFYKSSFEEYYRNEQPFPHVVFTPSLDKFPRRTTEKLVVDTDDAIHIFERNRNQVQVHGYAFHEICAVEMGTVLLESWLTFYGKTTQGEVSSVTITLNTTSLRHFEGVLKKLRPSPQVVDPVQVAAEKDKFDRLAQPNFKFMNYGRSCLVPGETVLQFLLQPEILEPFWTIFGRTFTRRLSSSHLTILTDQELILLRDPGRLRESNRDRYGGIWQFIPLRHLEAVIVSRDVNERLTLSVRSHPGQSIERLFDASNQVELEQLCSQVRTLIEGRKSH